MKYMIGIATKHTTGKAMGVGALEIGSRVKRESSRLGSRRRLVALHCLFGRRQKQASQGGDIVRGHTRDRRLIVTTGKKTHG
jgi:hypothetical protein